MNLNELFEKFHKVLIYLQRSVRRAYNCYIIQSVCNSFKQLSLEFVLLRIVFTVTRILLEVIKHDYTLYLKLLA